MGATFTTAAASTARKLPTRCTSQAVTGIETRAPDAIPNSTMPSRASLSPCADLTAGTRAAQLASRKPPATKKRASGTWSLRRGPLEAEPPERVELLARGGRIGDEMRELVERSDRVGAGRAELVGGGHGHDLGGVVDHRALHVRL